jgi:hypothetical protein
MPLRCNRNCVHNGFEVSARVESGGFKSEERGDRAVHIHLYYCEHQPKYHHACTIFVL